MFFRGPLYFGVVIFRLAPASKASPVVCLEFCHAQSVLIRLLHAGLEVPGLSGFVELPAGYGGWSLRLSRNTGAGAGPAQSADPIVAEVLVVT